MVGLAGVATVMGPQPDPASAISTSGTALLTKIETQPARTPCRNWRIQIVTVGDWRRFAIAPRDPQSSRPRGGGDGVPCWVAGAGCGADPAPDTGGPGGGPARDLCPRPRPPWRQGLRGVNCP